MMESIALTSHELRQKIVGILPSIPPERWERIGVQGLTASVFETVLLGETTQPGRDSLASVLFKSIPHDRRIGAYDEQDGSCVYRALVRDIDWSPIGNVEGEGPTLEFAIFSAIHEMETRVHVNWKDDVAQ